MKISLEKHLQTKSLEKHMQLRRHCLEKQARSCIQGMVEGGKMHLIVEISAKKTPHYQALIGKIRQALERDNLTKEEALFMRDKLLQQYGS